MAEIQKKIHNLQFQHKEVKFGRHQLQLRGRGL